MGEPSPLRNPLGTRGSACVEVMTTLHGSTPSPWRRAEGCVPSEGMIASARDPLTHPFYPIEPPTVPIQRIPGLIPQTTTTSASASTTLLLCITDEDFRGKKGIARGLWSESSPIDSKGKKPSGGRDQKMLPIPPRFRMDLHCSYHQGPGHDTDHCTALRHAIQDLIDQVSPSSGDIHHMDLIEDDSIHMLSWDDGLPEPIVSHDSYEVDGPEDDDSEGREIQIVTRSGRIAQPPPPTIRPFEGTTSHEEIRVETTTTPERLIHMMTAGRATCIVFSDDDLPPDGLDHVRPLYIIVGCSGSRVPSVLLDNGSTLNVCPLATAIALCV
ncbi:hypothetical protein AAG906_039532 [Vitis piasezkii]